MGSEDVLSRVKRSGRVSAEDVLEARRAVYGSDGRIDPGEIEALFRIDEAADDSDPAWPALLTEAGVDYLVHQVAPRGYIDAANADWLMARIDRDGAVKTATELELLVKVLEASRSSPPELVRYALRQIQRAVVHGDGPLAAGGRPEPGRVNREEADLLRRILYAFGGDDGIAVTRAEAEVLFDINDAVAGADNDPAWTDLFVKAVTNCIMAASGYVVPTREVALHREEWLDAPATGVGGFFARMASGGLHGVLAAYRAPADEDEWAAGNARVDAAIADAEAVTDGEAAWLADRIGRDGHLHEAEKALLRLIANEGREIHPVLAPLMAKAA
ncbi:MAG TPA: hypothetical protein PKA74_09580 [Bauldia sp.]|nr:hypothetical protein [Bauldia sp.]